MPLSTRARSHKANSVKGKHPTADYQSSDDEPAHPRPSTHKLKGPTTEQSDPKATISEADIATEAPVYKADNYETKASILLARDLKALGEGHAGAWDRKSLEEVAMSKLKAGLKTTQPAIAMEMRSYKNLIASEYQQLADRLEKIEELKKEIAQARREPSWFTRQEVAQAHNSWVTTRTSLGLPVEGDCDDLAPPEPVGRQEEELDSATDED
ncbi:MAG: hypothetical protein Q9161_000953 [Pseudevernia consocians]